MRVTVIATGFDKQVAGEPAHGLNAAGRAGGPPTVLNFPNTKRPSAPVVQPQQPRVPSRPAPQPGLGGEVSDMEIPTFIRRQMD